MVDSEDEWKIKKGRKPDLFCYCPGMSSQPVILTCHPGVSSRHVILTCHPGVSSRHVIPACHPGLVPGSPYTVPSAEHFLTFL